MTETNYTHEPFSMNDRPADLKNFDPQRDVKVVPDKEGKGETYFFPSDPPSDVNHQMNKLPKEMWQDYGNDNAGQVARAARMYERALDSVSRSSIAPEWWQTAGAMVFGGIAGVIVGGVSGALIENIPFVANDPHKKEYAKRLTEVIITASLVAGAEFAKEATTPKHTIIASAETSEMIRQARDQARKSYSEAVTVERKMNNIVPNANVTSPEQVEKMQEQRIENLVGAKK
jgi:hypothetical protein